MARNPRGLQQSREAPPAGEVAVRRCEWVLRGTSFDRVRDALAASRAAGAEFGDAWPPALCEAREVDRGTLRVTAGAWRAAYERRPPMDGECALARLAAELL